VILLLISAVCSKVLTARNRLGDSMQECRVCGLLFLGGGACPSCGSQVAIDIATDGITMDEDSIPGLDDVVNAMGTDDDSSVSGDDTLPFGMGAKAEVLQSSLPFGVGSFSEGIGEVTIPIFDDDDFSEDESDTDHIEKPVEIPSETHFETASLDNMLEDEPSVDITPTITNSVEPSSMVRLVAEVDSGLPIPGLDSQQELTESEPLQPVVDDVPDLWKIDAAAVDMDAIYAMDEQVIEVSFDEDMGSGDVEVSFDDFHHLAIEDSMNSDDTAPELHPARALPVEAIGEPELAQMVQLAFSHMGNSSWIQAAQVLSSASTNYPNDSSILNNLGLALLQSALEMDSRGDSMSSSQYEASIMALRQGAKIDAANNTLLLNLAHALLVSGRAEKALGVINVVRARDSANVEVENTLGACLIQLGRSGEAQSVLAPYSADAIVSANLGLI
tara:strand:+ start:193 stop:1530 length:1338 start_codon:yes stop_codon:yes gene_type:complete